MKTLYFSHEECTLAVIILGISSLVATFRRYLLSLSALDTKMDRAGSCVTLITNTKLHEATGQKTIT